MISLEEVWEKILEGFDYVISFEWIEDFRELFSGMFENITEFSIMGAIIGIIVVMLVYLFRGSVFILIKNPITKIIFYIIAFVMGYLMGKKAWD